jgi:heme exporter protein A
MIPDLVVDGVGKTFGRHRALIDVSTRFIAGRVATILGPNGAGKSTLLGILSTLARPTTGRVSWGPDALVPGAIARSAIGYLGHDPGLYGDLTARQNLQFFARLRPGDAREEREARIEALLARVGLGDVRRDAPARTFSRGMQQRLALARVLLADPALLLFDEPSAALDPSGAAWLRQQIREARDAGRIVIVVTHDIDAAAPETAHLLILRRGRAVVDQVLDRPPSAEALRALYQEKTGAGG